MAEALGIEAGGGKFAVSWPEELVAFWRGNASFGALVERTFNE